MYEKIRGTGCFTFCRTLKKNDFFLRKKLINNVLYLYD